MHHGIRARHHIQPLPFYQNIHSENNRATEQHVKSHLQPFHVPYTGLIYPNDIYRVSNDGRQYHEKSF